MGNTKVTLHDVFEITNRIERKLDQMGQRVSTLEVWKAEIMGRISIIVAVVTVSSTFVVDYVRKKLLGGD